MGKALFADLAEQFLSVTVKTWVMRSELTLAEAADVLLATAVQYGFLEDRGRPLFGNTLNEWGKTRNTRDGPYKALWHSLLLMDGGQPHILNGPLLRLYSCSRTKLTPSVCR